MQKNPDVEGLVGVIPDTKAQSPMVSCWTRLAGSVDDDDYDSMVDALLLARPTPYEEFENLTAQQLIQHAIYHLRLAALTGDLVLEPAEQAELAGRLERTIGDDRYYANSFVTACAMVVLWWQWCTADSDNASALESYLSAPFVLVLPEITGVTPDSEMQGPGRLMPMAPELMDRTIDFALCYAFELSRGATAVDGDPRVLPGDPAVTREMSLMLKPWTGYRFAPPATVAPGAASKAGADAAKASEIALKTELQRLQARCVSLEEALAQSTSRGDGLAASLEDLREVNGKLRSELYHQERGATAAASPGEVETATLTPIDRSTWSELERFEREVLRGRVILTPRAIKAARASVFNNIPQAYDALELLAESYLAAKQGDAAARSRWQDGLKRLRLDCAPVGRAAESQRYGDQYQVKHRGRSWALDMHLRGSSDRDPRYGFRLYFTVVDAESPYVLVGSFPEHLRSVESA